MLNDVKGYKTRRNAERKADAVPQHDDVQLLVIQRTWLDNRFVLVMCCESPSALQHGVGVAHAGHNVYVTEWTWLMDEVQRMPMQFESARTDLLDMLRETKDPFSQLHICRWFANCDRQATTTRPHPVLGDVACCERCAAFVDRNVNGQPRK